MKLTVSLLLGRNESCARWKASIYCWTCDMWFGSTINQPWKPNPRRQGWRLCALPTALGWLLHDYTVNVTMLKNRVVRYGVCITTNNVCVHQIKTTRGVRAHRQMIAGFNVCMCVHVVVCVCAHVCFPLLQTYACTHTVNMHLHMRIFKCIGVLEYECIWICTYILMCFVTRTDI